MFALKPRPPPKVIVNLETIKTIDQLGDGLVNNLTRKHTVDYVLVRNRLLEMTCQTYNPNPNVSKATECKDRALENACGIKANELLAPLYPKNATNYPNLYPKPTGGYRRKSRKSRSRTRRHRRR